MKEKSTTKPSKIGFYFKKISTGELVFLGDKLSYIFEQELQEVCDKYLTDEDFQYVVLRFFGFSIDNEEIWGHNDFSDYIIGV